MRKKRNANTYHITDRQMHTNMKTLFFANAEIDIVYKQEKYIETQQQKGRQIPSSSVIDTQNLPIKIFLQPNQDEALTISERNF